MEQNEKFVGSYKTMRASYKELNNLCALWFSYGFKNSYKITKEKIENKFYFVIWNEGDNKQIFKMEIN